MNLIPRITKICLCILLSFSFSAMWAQSDIRVQYFPANESHYAGLFQYSTETGEQTMYYAKDNEWTKETSVKSAELTISGKDFRMQFIAGNSTTHPGLFVYSTSGAFEFFYLDDGIWKPNTFLPASKSNLSSKKVRMNFTPATEDNLEYITIHATNKNEFEIVYLSNNNWVTSEFLPQEIVY